MEGGVETLSSRFIETVEQMPVRVEGDLDRGVPETVLDYLGMLALGDEHRRMRVSEVMKAEWLTDRAPHRRQPGAPAEVASKQRATLASGEHEPSW